MEKRTVADVFVESLIDWGVEIIFGMPGDGINGIMESLRKRADKIRFIQVRHEESAAFMAVGWAKYTGKLGVCLATSGPGGIHLLNGLYDAKGDGQPVLAITGMHYHDLLTTHAQQDVELDKVFQDVAVYNARVMGAAHIENVVDLACRTAISRHGVAHIAIPSDIQDQEPATEGSKHNVLHHTSDVRSWESGVPEQNQLQFAADILNQAQRPAILVGRGAVNSTEQILALSELLGAPVAKALLGKAAIADDHPNCTGPIGLLGTTASEELMKECDTLLMIGTSFPYIEYLPKPGQARGIQIERDASRIGIRYDVEVGLVGDTCKILDVLIPLIHPREKTPFLHYIQEQRKEWQSRQAIEEKSNAHPIKPQRLAYEIGNRLHDDAIVSVDSGTVTAWWARHIHAQPGQLHSVSGSLASMGCALPYAIAAQLAYPDRQSVAIIGDGGFAMLMAEFSTCVKYGLPVKVFVFKNNTLGQIKWEQLMFQGNPEYGCELQPIDHAAVAAACGGVGLSIEMASQLEDVLNAAFASTVPTLVDVEVDPLESPMYANLRKEQMENLQQALQFEEDADVIAEKLERERVPSPGY